MLREYSCYGVPLREEFSHKCKASIAERGFATFPDSKVAGVVFR